MSQLLTPSDVGRVLGVTPAAVRHMARRGALRVAATTRGGNRLFSEREVQRVARRRAATKSRAVKHAAISGRDDK